MRETAQVLVTYLYTFHLRSIKYRFLQRWLSEKSYSVVLDVSWDPILDTIDSEARDKTLLNFHII